MANDDKYHATIYDDVWRTLVHDFPTLLIAFVNEVFGENYSDGVRVEFLQDVHEQNIVDGRLEKRITDSYFRIIDESGVARMYHIECQSTVDNSMLIRIFEYGAQIALDSAVKGKDKIVMEFPHAAVLFLRSNSNTPDSMEIEIKVPDGCISYEIPVVKMKNYSIDKIFHKKLFILLPFYMFVVEKSLKECEENPKKLAELLESLGKIVTGLDMLLRIGVVDELLRRSLLELSEKVNYHLARNYKTVQKEAEAVMGGKVLEYEAKSIYMTGKSDGRAEMVIDMIKDNMKVERIAKIAKMTVEQVTAIGRKAALM